MIEEEDVEVPVTKSADTSSTMDVDKETATDNNIDLNESKGDNPDSNASESGNADGHDRGAETKPSQMEVEPPKVCQ